ncbi:hypothetical protein FOA52_002064 [Chlamydomonas sp. UWO 241]|nr:hypothetical protein FOA52_002064 [Chlamydomonas sp. UWO 241]
MVGARVRLVVVLAAVASLCLRTGSAECESEGPNITQTCIAGHVRDVLAFASASVNASAGDEYDAAALLVNGFINRCLRSENAIRPLRLLHSEFASVADGAASLVAEFQAKTGWKVIVDYVPSDRIVSELQWADKHVPLTYDGWIADASTLMDTMTSTTMVAPIDSFIRADDALQWPDVIEFVRTIGCTYAGSVVGVPMGSSPFFVFYRKDVFAMAGLGVPNTWDDVVLAAKLLNGSDFNRDGTTDHALCFQFDGCVDATVLTSLVLASMTQSKGAKTGYLFDPQTMQSFVGSAAMEATMGLLQEIMRFSAPGCTPGLISPNFLSGACAMTLSVDALFKVIQRNSPIRDLYGVANPPGSLRVLDRQTGRLEECTQSLCPYAKLVRTYDGHEMRVNQFQFGTGGLTGYVNARQDPVKQQAMYDFLSFVSEPKRSKKQVIETYFIGAFRKSHMDTSPASLAEWTAAGYNPAAVKELLLMMSANVDDPNEVMLLRMRGDSGFFAALEPAIHNASLGMAPAVIAADLATEFDTILASNGPIDVVRASLWASLGIPVPSPPPPPPLPSPAAPPRDANAGGSLPLGLVIGVTIPVTIVALALIVFFAVLRHSKRSLFGRHFMPAAGDDTTLVVTDIMDSTALWEALDTRTMGRAVATHHGVVRAALARFHGYEQATEGDSFLLAFHTPSDALGFAVQLQAGLLSAVWEPELLAHPSCMPVAMAQSAELVSAGGGDDRFHLRSAAAVLLGEREGPSRWLSMRFSSIPGRSPPVSDADTSRSPSHHSTNAAMAVRGAGAAAAATRVGGGAQCGGHGATPLASDPMAPTLRPASNGAAAAMVRFSGGICHDLSGAALPSGELHTSDELGSNLPPWGASSTKSMLVGKGGAYRKMNSSPMLVPHEESTAADGAAAPASMQRDAYRFEMAHAVALLQDMQAVASASEGTCGTATMAEYMCLAFDSATDARGAPTGKGQAAVVFRGLRVRVGMHSGVTKTDLEHNSTAGRMCFSGMPLALAKAVGDAGAGGSVLMTQITFARLQPVRALRDVLVLCLGDHEVQVDGAGPVCLYQAVERPLVPRLAAFEAMRGVEKLQLSVLDAPLGSNVAVVFSNMVGMATLQAWNKDQAARTFLIPLRTPLAGARLCLAAFREPASAVMWGLCLIEVMKHAEWDEELLDHELCEEVQVCTRAPAGQPRGSHAANVLFRGPRLKIGIDVGLVEADVSPVTGRMTYRGKVMNRAARICGKASSGTQWCSAAVWEQVVATCGDQLPSTGVLGTELGAFELKGITESVQLVQNSLGGAPTTMVAPPDFRRSSHLMSSESGHGRSPLIPRASTLARTRTALLRVTSDASTADTSTGAAGPSPPRDALPLSGGPSARSPSRFRAVLMDLDDGGGACVPPPPPLSPPLLRIGSFQDGADAASPGSHGAARAPATPPAHAIQGLTAGRVMGISSTANEQGLYEYMRPEGKSGGHGVGWSEIPRYSFQLPAGWKEVPVSIADLGGTEIDLRCSSEMGEISIVVAPVLRFADVGYNAKVRIEDIGTPLKVIQGFGPELYGKTIDDEDIFSTATAPRDGLTYYYFETRPHNLTTATATGNRMFIMSIRANSRQWKKFEPELRRIHKSFYVPEV